MLIDLHVHTNRYSACGRSTPEEMVERAIEVGLDGLAFTEHNLHWPREALAELQSRYPVIRLYNATELTSDAGDDYLVYGLTRREQAQAGMPATEILRMARAQGAAVVLAHPYRFHDEVPAEAYSGELAAIEIMSSNIYNYSHRPAVRLARELGLPVTAASDGHHVEALGMYAIEVEALPADEHALAALLHSGAIHPNVYGPRVASENALLLQQIAVVRECQAQGLPDRVARERAAGYLSQTVVDALRRGCDVLRPEAYPETLAERA